MQQRVRLSEERTWRCEMLVIMNFPVVMCIIKYEELYLPLPRTFPKTSKDAIPTLDERKSNIRCGKQLFSGGGHRYKDSEEAHIHVDPKPTSGVLHYAQGYTVGSNETAYGASAPQSIPVTTPTLMG